MFKVKEKETGEIYTVYAVNGNTFLIYGKLSGFDIWLWEPMGKFEPA